MEVFKNNQSLKSVVSLFNIVVDEKNCSPDEICLRSNLKNSDDVQRFIEKFSIATKSSWKVAYSLKDPKKLEYRKKWKCRFGTPKYSGASFEKLGCDAFIDVTILRKSSFNLRKDEFLRRDPPLYGIIKIGFNHDHDDYFKRESCLKQKNKVKEEFHDYFSIGVQQQEVKHLHEAVLLARGHKENSLADTNINPSNFMVNYLYMSWRKNHPKSTSFSFIKIQENQKHYREKDASVFVDDNVPFSVVVVTAAFKRAQDLMSSTDAVFVDTTLLSGCAFTTMFIETSVGAVPIVILIHQDQTEKSYLNAFNLLKSNEQSCFGNGMAPNVFITNDNSFMKLALSEVWPSSKQILGYFYITVAEWNFIWSHVQSTEEKLKLMKLFHSIMYASNEAEIDVSVKEMLSRESEYPIYVQHFKKLLKRRHEWIQYDKLQRKSVDMNSYSELTIRIFKNVILTHCETFTLTTLIEFCISAIGEYLITHFSNFMYKEPGKERLLFRALYKKKISLACQMFSEDNFLVQNEINSDVYYLVNGNFGVCSCDLGNTGAFCLHQTTLFEEGKFKLPSLPVITQADEFDLSFLALGDKSPLSNFLSNEKNKSKSNSTEELCKDRKFNTFGAIHTPEFQIENEVLYQCRTETNRILSLIKSKTHEPTLIKFTHMLRNIQTECDAVSILEATSSAIEASQTRVNLSQTILQK